MIEELENEHETLLLEQKRLEAENAGGDQLPGFIDKVRAFIEECVEKSEQISHMTAREQLLSIIDYWGQFVFGKTGQSTPHSLEPSLVGLTWSGMTWEKLRDAIRGRARAFLADRKSEGVFDPELSVIRRDIDQQLWQFLESHSLAMALTGQAGVGKTFLISYLAHQSIDDGLLVLPYDAQDIERAASASIASVELNTIIEQQIAHDLGYADTQALTAELEYVDNLLKEHGARLLICIDSIESFRLYRSDAMGISKPILAARELVGALNHVIQTFTWHEYDVNRIRFLLTCVEAAWLELGSDRLLTRSLFFFPEGEERTSWSMGNLTEDEFALAYRNHTGEDPEGPRYKAACEICQGSPYLLRLSAELMKEGKDVTSKAVFARFLMSRVLRGSKVEQVQRERFLVEFMDKFDESLDGVLATELSIEAAAYTLLKLDGILTQDMSPDRFPSIVIHLWPRGLLGFLRSEYSKPGPGSGNTKNSQQNLN